MSTHHLLMPLYEILVIGIGTHFAAQILESIGHGDKVMLMKIVSYVLCGWIAYETWWKYLRRIAAAFGVFV